MLNSGRDGPQSNHICLEEAYITASGVYDDMTEMRQRLGDAGLEHIFSFNDVYQELTGEVRDAILRGEFRLPHVVARTMPIFYDYYDKAVHAHELGGFDEVSGPWQQVFYDERVKRALPGIRFLSGMNTHINTDLSQATNDSKVGDEYYYDYKIMMGKVIRVTARRLSADYIPGPSIGKKVLATATVYSIANDRETAWWDGKELQAAEDETARRRVVRRVERNSIRKGEKILSVGSFALNGLALIAA